MIKKAVVLAVFVGALVAVATPVVAQTGPFSYYAVTPCRVADTRETGTLGQGGIMTASVQRNMTVQGRCGVPSGSKAVSLNVTIVSPTNEGFVSLWPVGGVFPVVSTINFLPGEPALANGAIVPLATTTPDLAVIYGTASGSGSIHVILDVTGYFL